MEKSIYEGLKVLDLTRIISGPYCTMLLGDMGADVVKVEKRGEGDTSRTYGPYVNGESMYYYVLNRNKRSLSLDFRSPKGKKLLFELARGADVIIQNFKPGTIAKMGIGEEQLRKVNPRVIFVNISGFGQEGPYAERPGFDAVAQAMSGIMSVTGMPDQTPVKTGAFIIDYMTGLYALIALQGALYERERSGVGQSVEACLLDSAISVLLTGIPYQKLLNHTVTRMGNRDGVTAPSNVYRTKDGEWVLFIAGSDDFFGKFARISGQEFLLEDERFSSIPKRLEHEDEVDQYVAGWIGQLTAAEVVSQCAEAGITCAKVDTMADVVDNPQLRYRHKIIEVEHPKVGVVPMQGFPFDCSRSPLTVRYAPPMLGENSEEILRDWLDLSDGEISRLAEEGVI